MKTGFAVVLAVIAAALTPRLDAQPSSCTPHAQSQGKRVDEAGFVPLGGIEQWVTVRGDDGDNPILLHVHGGPGIALSAFVAEFAPFDKAFTSVQWDQRGSGCTFGRYRDAPLDVTLDQLALDGIELATYLHQRFPGRGLIVLGHSFGTIVATEMVRRAPHHFGRNDRAERMAQHDEPATREALMQIRRELDAVERELVQSDVEWRVAVAAERATGTALVPLHAREGLVERRELGDECGQCDAGTAVHVQQNRVVAVVAAHRDPLFDAAERHEAGFVDALALALRVRRAAARLGVQSRRERGGDDGEYDGETGFHAQDSS